jgi:hypothetical protein
LKVIAEAILTDTESQTDDESGEEIAIPSELSGSDDEAEKKAAPKVLYVVYIHTFTTPILMFAHLSRRRPHPKRSPPPRKQLHPRKLPPKQR